uniref:Uncharacterized protein n=1 Tax=Triticum urartu TaxID=4572 RepID=A0A8R7P6Y6_TRIUA
MVPLAAEPPFFLACFILASFTCASTKFSMRFTSSCFMKLILSRSISRDCFCLALSTRSYISANASIALASSPTPPSPPLLLSLRRRRLLLPPECDETERDGDRRELLLLLSPRSPESSESEIAAAAAAACWINAAAGSGAPRR